MGYFVLVGVTLLISLPIIALIIGSLKQDHELMKYPIVILPEQPQWANYVKVFTLTPFLQVAVRTFTLAFVVALISTAVNSMIGYGFARYRVPGSRFLFGIVIAMLIVPAACARLLSDRLGATLLWAVVFAALSSVLGHLGAVWVPSQFGFAATSSSGGMAVAAGLLFAGSVVFAPRHGLLRRWLHNRKLYLLTLEEDLLGNLMRAADQAHPMTLPEVLARVPEPRSLRAAFSRLRRRGYVDGRELTHKGIQAGAGLLRSHRLWESWLHEHTPLAMDHLHEPAELLEHVTDASLRERLAAEAGTPHRDPMGRPIPPDVSQGPETIVEG
jgi:hypothetical protein